MQLSTFHNDTGSVIHYSRNLEKNDANVDRNLSHTTRVLLSLAQTHSYIVSDDIQHADIRSLSWFYGKLSNNTENEYRDITKFELVSSLQPTDLRL